MKFRWKTAVEIRWRGGEKTEQLDNLRSIELRAVQERKQKDDPTKKKRTILNECPQYDKCLRNRKVGLTSTNKQTEPLEAGREYESQRNNSRKQEDPSKPMIKWRQL